MQILGGNQWIDIFEYMDQLGVVVVGTLAPFLGAAGGSLQGGGVGPLIPQHGLVVDNLLEADIVIADGSLLTVNKC